MQPPLWKPRRGPATWVLDVTFWRLGSPQWWPKVQAPLPRFLSQWDQQTSSHVCKCCSSLPCLLEDNSCIEDLLVVWTFCSLVSHKKCFIVTALGLHGDFNQNKHTDIQIHQLASPQEQRCLFFWARHRLACPPCWTACSFCTAEPDFSQFLANDTWLKINNVRRAYLTSGTLRNPQCTHGSKVVDKAPLPATRLIPNLHWTDAAALLEQIQEIRESSPYHHHAASGSALCFHQRPAPQIQIQQTTPKACCTRHSWCQAQHCSPFQGGTQADPALSKWSNWA